MKIYSYAKINLIIEILGKFENGYHNLKGIYQNINLRDEININESDHDSVLLSDSSISEKNNIVYKAIKNFKSTYNLSSSFEITINKRIPISSGLGGGSSNASSVIMAINNILKLNIPLEELSLFSSKLGSDLPFFFKGGTCLIKGYGENVYKLNDVRNRYLYLYDSRISIDNKTQSMFNSLDSSDFTDGKLTEKIKGKIQNNEYLDPEDFFNCFQVKALNKFPNLRKKYYQMVEIFGNCFLTGAGMTLISMSDQNINSDEFQRFSTINKGFDIDN